MAREPSPTVSRRRLAAELRRLREDAQVTGTQVAQVLDGSSSKVSRMEKAQVAAHREDVARLADFYQVRPAVRDALLTLAAEAEGKGWWDAHNESLSESYTTFIGLEAGAEKALTWQNIVFPGLLQTPDYARALIGFGDAWSPQPPTQIERLVRVRTRRGHILEGPDPLSLSVLLEESVLMRRFGSPEVMRDQVRHVLRMAEQPNVSVRVVPLERSWVFHGFVLLKFPQCEGLDALHDDIVYIENARDAIFEENEQETFAYERVFHRILAAALSEEDSLKLIGEHAR
ncbi:DUF5753 domain-containing protein [Nonomuraea recticatena]|uniref:Helix-turn-helix transcriptional regulator n=1 Tax=Nonomuraea recticatena TaxID=46178 RepID=A0ABN3RM95_9ACTN